MGNSSSSQSDGEAKSEPGSSPEKSRKRGHGDDDSGEPDVKITKLDTAKYVYEKLFVQGEGSDIAICALGNTWHLHKLYLQQCQFFEALINGSWKDSKDDVLNLEVPDESITVSGLHAVFGSLYHNELKYKADDIESILAAASLFQLNSLLEKCDAEMNDELDSVNVLHHLNLADKFGLRMVRKTATVQLKSNFWKLMKNRKMLVQLRQDTFLNLIASPDLLILEGEQDLYSMLKMWIVLQERPELADESDKSFEESIADVLSDFEIGELFLQHAALFSALRLHHLVTSSGSMAVVEKDGLVPRDVLRAIMVDQWKTVIQNEENPQAYETVSDEGFYLSAIRLGRLIDSAPKCWRWSGYNYGVDIILNYNRGLLTMKRNCLHQATPYSINLKTDRTVHFRVIVSDDSGTCIYDSRKQLIAMRLDQSVVLCRVPDTVSFPFTVHFFYLASQPTPPSFLYVNQYVKSRISQTV